MHKNTSQAKTNWQNKKKKQTLNNKGNNFSRAQKLLIVWKLFVLRLMPFLRSKFFRKKIRRSEIVLITSFAILLRCTPINTPIENLFVYAYVNDNLQDFFYIIICRNLFLPVRIHFHFCFLSVRIYFYLYVFVWMLKHQKYWYSFCWEHCEMNNFWLNYEC